jgi:excisionase family DNA binding protein
VERPGKRKTEPLAQLIKHIRENRPLTTFEVSRVCGVVHSTVSNWIDEGKLTAYRTPGGHRRVRKSDLLLFLKFYEIPVPKEIMDQLESGITGLAGAQSDPKQGAFKILVVEDDAALSEILVETLKKNFPEAQTAQAFDGFEAGKKLVSFAPDLVILDLILPGMDGFKIIENIRSDSDNRRTRILAITGHDSADNRQKVLQAGNADALIIKPIQLEDFKAQVRVQIAEAQRIKGA